MTLTIEDSALYDKKIGRGCGKGGNQWRERNHQWKGGRKKTYGYWKVLRQSHHRADSEGYVYEHIIVFEETHDCSVLRWGAIHHRDGNKSNNVWYNLQGMTRRQHMRLHAVGRPISAQAKVKLRERFIGKKIAPFSEEHKNKIRLALKGRKMSEEHKKKTRRKPKIIS